MLWEASVLDPNEVRVYSVNEYITASFSHFHFHSGVYPIENYMPHVELNWYTLLCGTVGYSFPRIVNPRDAEGPPACPGREGGHPREYALAALNG